jgi:hypothetical protein
MRQIIIQSTLLEEHLAQPKKRCPSCIVKHFSLIVGLSQEALGLSGDRVAAYPHMHDSSEFYERTFADWIAVKDAPDRSAWLPIHDALRARRRLISEHYVLGTGKVPEV